MKKVKRYKWVKKGKVIGEYQKISLKAKPFAIDILYSVTEKECSYQICEDLSVFHPGFDGYASEILKRNFRRKLSIESLKRQALEALKKIIEQRIGRNQKIIEKLTI